ncbi:hypothetical protein Smp_212240 [Schistosoma mansoni]|uniref:Arrestin_C domain-containing protein n=1 Tax=Schistosoma mansoni TaxID=6183 RepID=G4M0D2_SCHMA|nr:hypothetical protein Smp_212240 [Schistosoma mansoni]|eukprot:XP_018646949.1 hypothetical protein Smp_212240 [Schistosoma mansoni]
MEYESPMSLKIEINIENELGVFEPRDDVAGHIVIKTEEDTEIDSCILWLYGLAKTRWNTQNESCMSRPGSLASGINLSTSTTNFNKFTNTNICIAENKICKLLSNASNILKQTKSCKSYETVSPHTHLTCCTDRGYLSDTHCKSNCNYNHSSCALDHDLICETRIGESWISASGSLTSSLDAESSNKSIQNFGKLASPNTPINNNDYPLRSIQQITKTTDKIYDSTCLPNFCLEQWKRLFEIDEEKKKCIYHGDLQLIYKSKLDLLKQYNNVLSSKPMENIDQFTTNNTIETLKNDNHLNKSSNDIEYHYDKFNLNEQTNKNMPSNNTNKKYYDLLNDNNDTSEKLQPSIDKHGRTKTKFTLTRGIHVFYFEFPLPADLPSTFELPTNCLAGGASASITYAVRIELCNNRLKLRHIQQREIIVFRPLELIHFPRLRDRITLHREFVSLGCCSHPSGLILCDLAVNKTGFVPGETIIPQVHITNRSGRAIQTVHLTFAQTVFLKGINEQNHIEVLRIFATRLNAQSTLSGYNLFEQLDINKIPSVFSPSNSFSSRSSTNRFERIEQQQQQQKTHRHNNVNSKNNKQIKSQSKHKHRQKLYKNSLSTNIIAVPDQGGQAYFTDLIHVPPLPTSGLFGRQNLIYLEYSLILRLRMQGDREGKHDHCMQIPITIGSDPTRETSFIGNDEVVPCYASFDFASGDIIEYDPSNQSPSLSLTPVYRYFKPKPIEPSLNKMNHITLSSDSPSNNNNNNSSSIKSLQIINKSSPSILKQPNMINTTSTTNITMTRNNHPNSFKSMKSLSSSFCPNNEPIQQKPLDNTNSWLNNKMNDAMVTTIPLLSHSDDLKSESYSRKKSQGKTMKHSSLNKLKRQSNFQEITPVHKTDILTIMNQSPQLRLSDQQYFDDGDIILRDITIMDIENQINSLSSKLKSLKQTQSDTLNLSSAKKQNYKQQSMPTYHQKYSEKNEKTHLLSDHSSSTSLPHQQYHHDHRLQNYYRHHHHHHHHSSTSPPCLENSKLEYRCKSQANIPIHQYFNDLLLDQPFSYGENNENVKIIQNQSNDHSYCYNLDSFQANQMDYTTVIHNDGDNDDDDDDVEEVDDEEEEDNENGEEDADEDDEDDDDEEDDDGEEEEEGNIPSGSNNYDDITSDEINKCTMKSNQFHTYPCDSLKYCTDKMPIKQHEGFDHSYHTNDKVDKDSDDEDDNNDHRDNDNEIMDRINNLEDNCQIGDYEEVMLKQYDTQSKHVLSISQEDSPNENDNISSDITDLYHKVQKISDNKQISLNYRFKQSKDLYNAYWNCPKVAPIIGRKSNTDGFWTYGHGSINENINTTTNSNNTNSYTDN